MKNRSRRWLAVLLAASMALGQGSVSAFAEGETQAAAAEAPVTEAPVTEAPVTEPPTSPRRNPRQSRPPNLPRGPHRAAYRGADRSAGYGSAGPRRHRQRQPGRQRPRTQIRMARLSRRFPRQKPSRRRRKRLLRQRPPRKRDRRNERKTDRNEDGNRGRDGYLYLYRQRHEDNGKAGEGAAAEHRVYGKNRDEKDSPKQWKQAVKQIENVTNEGHRELARARFYQLVFLADGEEVTPEGAMDLQISFDKGLDWGCRNMPRQKQAFSLWERTVRRKSPN